LVFLARSLNSEPRIIAGALPFSRRIAALMLDGWSATKKRHPNLRRHSEMAI
jgi:hypothetical protein